jgi:uncharacterized membrane protein
MTEKEQDHRHWLDRRFVRYRTRAQVLATSLAVLAIGGGVFLIDQGKSGAGFALILIEVAAIVAVFLVRQFGMNGEGAAGE